MASVKKWIEKKLENEYIRYFKYDEFSEIVEIGRGSFGKVSKANLTNTGLVVALKTIINKNSNELNEVDDEIIKELKLLREVDYHPKINRCLGITKDSEHYILVLEYANEGSLSDYLKTKFTSLKWHDKIQMALDITSGLKFLHAKEIIHRDLHSKNILVNNGKLLIADLGLSKKLKDITTGSMGCWDNEPKSRPGIEEVHEILSQLSTEVFFDLQPNNLDNIDDKSNNDDDGLYVSSENLNLNPITILNNEIKEKENSTKKIETYQNIHKNFKKEISTLFSQIQTKSTELNELIDRIVNKHYLGKKGKLLITDNMWKINKNYILDDNNSASEELKSIKQNLIKEYELSNKEINEILNMQEVVIRLNMRFESTINEESMTISSSNTTNDQQDDSREKINNQLKNKEETIEELQNKLNEENRKYQDSLKEITALNNQLENKNDSINKLQKQTDELTRLLNEETEKYQNSKKEISALLPQIKTRQTELNELVNNVGKKHEIGKKGRTFMDNILEKQGNVTQTNENSASEELERIKRKLIDDYELTEEEIQDILHKQAEKTKLDMQLMSLIN
ncbi:unnamed protein product [Rhizophagus irregularis]|nr:unnamed protein product [Rhizophagus irregularis]